VRRAAAANNISATIIQSMTTSQMSVHIDENVEIGQVLPTITPR